MRWRSFIVLGRKQGAGELIEKKAAIAEAMKELAARMLQLSDQLAPQPPAEAEGWLLGQLARQIHGRRRSRAEWFPTAAFGEPAWDILLELYASESDERTVSVKGACVGADVPATTALRHLDLLEEAGLIKRLPAEADRRMLIVKLTDEARVKMTAYLAQYAQQ